MMRASRSPRRSLPGFALDMALRDMSRKPDPFLAEVLKDLNFIATGISACASADDTAFKFRSAAKALIEKVEAHNG